MPHSAGHQDDSMSQHAGMMQPGMGGQMGQAMQQCIQECLNCHSVRVQTVGHCLQMGGPHAEASHIRLLLD